MFAGEVQDAKGNTVSLTWVGDVFWTERTAKSLKQKESIILEEMNKPDAAGA